MEETEENGGYRRIYQDLLRELERVDLAVSARHLGLPGQDTGEIEVVCLGEIYKVSKRGIRQKEGSPFPEPVGSVLAHYIIKASCCEPAGRFVTFAELAGPLFKQGSYSRDALEYPLVKRYRGRVPELLAAAASLGGRIGGEGGLGSVSLILELLPKIPVQLVFYDQDEEFPARATLLYDRNATLFIEFEFLAVLATYFVQALLRKP
jgi:hypothetical protein